MQSSSKPFTFPNQNPSFITDPLLHLLAGLTLTDHYNRYDLCLSHLEEAADELEAIWQENDDLCITKKDLAKRLSGICNGRAIVDEFRSLRLAEEGTSPSSILGESFAQVEKPVTLRLS